jgi:tetratricopeptide (TPR) repeat protein
MERNVTDTVDVYGFELRADMATHWQHAATLAQGGNPAAAAVAMQKILVAQPEFVPAMLQSAYFLLANDRYRDAHALAVQASQSPGGSLELVFEIVKLLRLFEEIEAIETGVERQDWSNCQSGQLLVQLAAQIAPLGLYAPATHLLDLAEGIAPEMTAVATLHGTISTVQGNKQAADAWYRRALAIATDALPHVHWLMSLSPGEEPVASIAAIRHARQQVAPGGEAEAYLSFALHNTCHAAGLYKESWQALVRGCQLKRRLEPYDRGAQHAMFEMLRGIDPAAGMGDALAEGGLPAAGEGPGLIFIVGMHRSGTTLLERMLAGHGEIADGGESSVFSASLRHVADHYTTGVLDAEIVRRLAEADLREAGDAFRRYARWRAAGRGWLTEKLPSNFLTLGFILRALPEARILHMRRDPVDTCFSNLRTFFSGTAAYSYDQGDLADFHLQYQALMRHWHACAPGRILDIDYATLVGEPEPQARRIAQFCGVEYVPDMLQVDRAGGAVATASIGSVRAGILKDRGGAWKPYRKYLEPLLEGLASVRGEDRGEPGC